MKFKLLITLLASILLLTGCSSFDQSDAQDTSSDNTALPSENVYSSLIGLLGNEIDRLKKEQLAASEEYEKRLEELESKLEASISSPDTTTPDNGGSEQKEPSPFTYTIDDGKATITSYTGKYAVLVIPEKIDGYQVTAISDSAFAGNTDLTSVSVPSGVTKIGWFAFSGCTSLVGVTLPESVSDIGYDAFAYCTKLTVYCVSGSYSEKYATSYGISCVAS